jgi:hypothetical protein
MRLAERVSSAAEAIFSSVWLAGDEMEMVVS